uniref:Uncharacterized protein n=1 Tax=Oryzias melastigma TaxID=30732 RepID=A0A3B3DKQ7_ORYME
MIIFMLLNPTKSQIFTTRLLCFGFIPKMFLLFHHNTSRSYLRVLKWIRLMLSRCILLGPAETVTFSSSMLEQTTCWVHNFLCFHLSAETRPKQTEKCGDFSVTCSSDSYQITQDD